MIERKRERGRPLTCYMIQIIKDAICVDSYKHFEDIAQDHHEIHGENIFRRLIYGLNTKKKHVR